MFLALKKDQILNLMAMGGNPPWQKKLSQNLDLIYLLQLIDFVDKLKAVWTALFLCLFSPFFVRLVPAIRIVNSDVTSVKDRVFPALSLLHVIG
jgi:hypothetical protein